MESLNDMCRWDPDGGDEKTSTAIDDNSNQLIELSLGVIVAVGGRTSAFGMDSNQNWGNSGM